MWGSIRDSVGDKKCINLTAIMLAVALGVVGFSWNLTTMLISIFFVGLACGLFVPGLAFCNWIEPQKRDKLVMWIYIFSGAGSLSGPFIGSMLFSLFRHNRLPKTFITISLMMILALLCFNYAFREYDDRVLIDQSKYSELIEEENYRIRTSLIKD